MKKNIKLLVEYDGTNYVGWQRQPKFQGESIQGLLEESLEKIVCHQVQVIGAGRTDSGVHALGQVANFFTSSSIPVERLPAAVSSLLPRDIVVRKAREVPEDFHARYSAVEKTYRYTILVGPCRSAFEWRYSYHIPYQLNLEKMYRAAELMVGSHDFSSFCSQGSPVKNFVRTLKECRITNDDRHVNLEVTADGFLYNMVRIIVGTLLEVGRGRWEPEKVMEIIAARDRRLAGPTAPPQGLILVNVKY